VSEWWLLGNGPSLTDEQIHEAEKHTMVVCNDFWRHPEFETLDIDWYLVCDPLYGKEPRLSEIGRAYEDNPCQWMVYNPRPIYGERVMRVMVYDNKGPLHHDLREKIPLPAWSVIIDMGFPLALGNGATKIVVAGVDFDYMREHHFYEGAYDPEWRDYDAAMRRARQGTRSLAHYARDHGVEVEFRGGFRG